MDLLARIDIALHEVGKTRAQLAEEIGVTRQTIVRLSRSPGATMKLPNVAHAARAMKCDLYWLCTGEGGHYVPAEETFSFLATEMAKLVDSMPPRDRDRAFVVLFGMAKGCWPELPDDHPPIAK